MRQRREFALHVHRRPAGVQHRIDREVAGGAEQDGVAVGIGLRDALGRDQAVGARAVLDDHGLAEPLRHLRRHQPRQDVDAAARRKSDDDPDRPGGKRLRPERLATNGAAAAPSTKVAPRGRWPWRFSLFRHLRSAIVISRMLGLLIA